MKRIKWVDRLKGLLCIGVLTHHFLLAFYPAVANSNPEISHTKFDLLITKQPFTLFYNGQFFVCVFLVLSGYVLTKKRIKNIENNKISESLFKRFFVYYLPIFVVCVLVFVFKNNNLFFNKECAKITLSENLKNAYNKKLTFSDLIVAPFIKTLKSGPTVFMGQTWMMTVAFEGGFLVEILQIVFGEKSIKGLAFIVLPIMWFIAKDSLLLCYVFGYLLAYLKEKTTAFDNRKFMFVILFVVSLYFGSYPQLTKPTDRLFLNIYNNFNIKSITIPILIYEFSALLLCGAFCFVEDEVNNLEIRFSDFLGKISFDIYLLHDIIINSFSSLIFITMYRDGNDYNVCALFTYIATVLMTILVSYLFNKYIRKYTNYISKRLYEAIRIENK